MQYDTGLFVSSLLRSAVKQGIFEALVGRLLEIKKRKEKKF